MVTVHTVPIEIANRIEGWVTSSKIPWFYFDHTLGVDYKGSYPVEQEIYTIRDLPRLSHYFFPNSKTPKEDINFIMPLVQWIRSELLPEYEVKRAMGNLTTYYANSENLLNIPHVDSNDSNKITFLYYINNSDGKTIFFKDGRIYCEVEPIKGTGVLFPSNTVHAGQVPAKNSTRYVINLLFSRRV